MSDHLRKQNVNDFGARKTVYGFKDAAKHWYESLMEVLRETRKKKHCMECTHVDDLCFGGIDMFHKEVISRMKEILKVGAMESTRFKYLGMNVVDKEEERIILDQNQRKIEETTRDERKI